MTFDQMMGHCKAGGKARRQSWTSDSVTFVEGLRLGVRFMRDGQLMTCSYTANLSDRNATDWEIAR